MLPLRICHQTIRNLYQYIIKFTFACSSISHNQEILGRFFLAYQKFSHCMHLQYFNSVVLCSNRTILPFGIFF